MVESNLVTECKVVGFIFNGYFCVEIQSTRWTLPTGFSRGTRKLKFLMGFYSNMSFSSFLNPLSHSNSTLKCLNLAVFETAVGHFFLICWSAKYFNGVLMPKNFFMIFADAKFLNARCLWVGEVNRNIVKLTNFSLCFSDLILGHLMNSYFFLIKLTWKFLLSFRVSVAN